MKSFFPNQFSHGIRAQNLGFSSRTFFFLSLSLQSFEAHSMATTVTATTSSFKTHSSTPLTQDSSNVNDPLFLHHGENPGAILVSQPLIGGENYPAWA